MNLCDYESLDLWGFKTHTWTPGLRQVNFQPRYHCRYVQEWGPNLRPSGFKINSLSTRSGRHGETTQPRHSFHSTPLKNKISFVNLKTTSIPFCALSRNLCAEWTEVHLFGEVTGSRREGEGGIVQYSPEGWGVKALELILSSNILELCNPGQVT